MKPIKIKIFLFTLLILCFANNVYANTNDNNILDKKITKFCKEYNVNKFQIDDNMKKRCYLIWQAMYRFEKWWECKISNNNNCFNFRYISYKNKKNDFWVLWIDKSWFSIFKTRTDSIRYFVYHFYTFNRFKTIRQIIAWWQYISPVDHKLKKFTWFTSNKEHHENYIHYVRKYYFENLK